MAIAPMSADQSAAAWAGDAAGAAEAYVESQADAAARLRDAEEKLQALLATRRRATISRSARVLARSLSPLLGAMLALTVFDETNVVAAQANTEKEAARTVQVVIATAEHLQRYSKAEVEKLLGVTLKPSDGVPFDPKSMEATIARGVFAKVRYREIRPASGLPSWILSLDVRADVVIPRRLIDPKLIGPRSEVIEHASPETIFMHSIDRAGGHLHLGFGVPSGRLRKVIIVREGSAERSSGKN